MNKNDFESELKELMSYMSEEEIEKAIGALCGCKTAVYKKNSQEKGAKAILLSTTELRESELYYIGEGRKEGTIKAIGASLLSGYDFDLFGENIPGTNDSWWLYDKSLVSNNIITRIYEKNTASKIRPMLIIDDINGGLKPKEIFYINNEKFNLISPYIAIRADCLEDWCTYNATDYKSSMLKLCVDGWYMNLIHQNELLKQAKSSAT